MDNNIDQLLASFKTQPKAEKPIVPPQEEAGSTTAGSGLPPAPHSVEELLTQLNGKPVLPPEKTIVSAPFQPNSIASVSPPPVFSPPVPNLPSLQKNPLLDDLKAEFAERQRQEAEQQRLREEQQRREAERLAQEHRVAQERLAQEKRKLLEKKAEVWLRELQPLSGEALWFDQFASHYPSRLEAAIVYLSEE